MKLKGVLSVHSCAARRSASLQDLPLAASPGMPTCMWAVPPGHFEPFTEKLYVVTLSTARRAASIHLIMFRAGSLLRLSHEGPH